MRDPNCTLCRLHKTAQFVCLWGEGPKHTDIMIVGEAPGHREDDSGRPFVGKAGKLLEENLIAHANLTRDDVYITNAVHCRPPDNRTPSKGEIKTCRVWLDQEIQHVRPKFILLLGNVPLQSITGKPGITSRRGRPFEDMGIIYLPTFHPAFILRDPTQLPLFEADLRLLRNICDRGEVPRETDLRPRLVTTWNDVEDMLNAMRGTVSFDIETTGLYAWKSDARITMIGFGTSAGEFSIPLDMWGDQIDHIIDRCTEKIEDCFLVAHNGKFDFVWMKVHFGVSWYEHFAFDTMLAHYILDENSRHGLKELSQKYCGAPDWDIDKEQKKGVNIAPEKLGMYHAHDLHYTRKLRFIFGRQLDKEGDSKLVFDHILMPCARLFTEIEYDGIHVNHKQFGDVEAYLSDSIKQSKKALSKYGNINWASTKQLADLLYNKLGVDCPQFTLKGNPSVGESALNQIDHPCVAELIKYRGAKQQLSFFIEGWKPFLHRKRIAGEWHYFLHSTFKLHGTVTGRLSSEHPNLQQVPRDERIRSLLDAPPGWTLVECDLSQIEMRVAAELANERHMLEAFNTGVDIHWVTALRSLERGGGGAHTETIFSTVQMFLLSIGLPANGIGAKVLLRLWEKDKGRKSSAPLLSISNSGSGKRKQSVGKEEPHVERWLESYNSSKEVSQDVLREVREYAARLSSSHRSKPAELEKIEFGDAMQVLSYMGASTAETFSKAWKELRKKAKAEGFGFLYGMGYRKFQIYARDNYGITLTYDQAKDSRNNFFSLYSDLVKWHDKQRRYVKMNGYVKSLSGRKRRLPDARISDDNSQQHEAERQAINSPVQSFANDLCLMSMIQLREEFSRDKVRIVAAVHDAALFYVKNDYVEPVTDRMLQIMSHPRLLETFKIDIKVPIEAEAKIGPWGIGIPFDKWRNQHVGQNKVDH